MALVQANCTFSKTNKRYKIAPLKKIPIHKVMVISLDKLCHLVQ